jgi:hypothetical protein
LFWLESFGGVALLLLENVSINGANGTNGTNGANGTNGTTNTAYNYFAFATKV